MEKGNSVENTTIKISICIPVYNGEKYLPECIESAINQTYQNIEILFLDDGSTDESVNIIKRYQQQDSRIKLLINKTNLGLVGNWNKCIKEAEADWIKFLFQDDILMPECVELMLNACFEHQTLICICNRKVLIDEKANAFSIDYFSNETTLFNKIQAYQLYIFPNELAAIAAKNLLNNFLGEPITMLFHRHLVKRWGYYNEDLHQLVDYEFTLRIGLNNKMSLIQRSLVTFRVHAASASSNQSIDILKKARTQYIDYVLLLHEQLYNPHFKSYKLHIQRWKHIRFAIAFYQTNKDQFPNAGKILKSLSKKYKYLNTMYLLSIPYGFLRNVYYKFFTS